VSGFRIDNFAYSARFQAEFKALSVDVQKSCIEALKTLQNHPQARSLRLHTLKGMPKPTIWKIDIYANHSWQITFELVGTTAELKRVGTHKTIDRDPRG
jgi:mRNA-degrading endonuclease YafQ of YafQ-DinJ toxin-antitoxin module